MISIKLQNELTDDFISLIPKQRKIINELMDEGKVLQYSLALDRSQLWVIVSANSETKAMDIISTFPLIKYMKPKIFELAFHNSLSNELPKLIMN
jgi:muconolactone delta-isomerase